MSIETLALNSSIIETLALDSPVAGMSEVNIPFEITFDGNDWLDLPWIGNSGRGLILKMILLA